MTNRHTPPVHTQETLEILTENIDYQTVDMISQNLFRSN